MAVTSNLAAGQVLTASTVNSYMINSGYVYISKTSFSGASSVSVSSCFSATYDRYLIVARITGSNLGGYAYARFKLGSTEYTTNFYYKYGYFIKYSGSLSTYAAGGETNIAPLATFTGLANECRWEVQNPYSSSYRTSSMINTNDPADGSAYNINGVVAGLVGMDGFNVYPSGGIGTMTGDITIYGMRQP